MGCKVPGDCGKRKDVLFLEDKIDLGRWGEWRECSGPAIAIKPQVTYQINQTIAITAISHSNQTSGPFVEAPDQRN